MRIWVIGNGPSLKIKDLEALYRGGEYCIGVNRIHVWYDKMKWRPNVWVCDDSWKAVDPVGDFMFHGNQGYEVWVRDTMLYDFTAMVTTDPKLNTVPSEHAHPDDPIAVQERIDMRKRGELKQAWWTLPNLHIFHDCLHQVEYRNEPPPPWHLPYPCSYGWSIYIAAQLAVMKGAKQLVFLGCDGYYPDDGSPTHMTKDYIMRHTPGIPEDTLPWPQDWGYRNDNLARGHAKIQEECDLREISVINASRETHITAHERKTLEEVLRGR